jgi:hypothetical protein
MDSSSSTIDVFLKHDPAAINDEGSYTSLVQNVLNAKPLKEKVAKFASTQQFINLVTPEWRSEWKKHFKGVNYGPIQPGDKINKQTLTTSVNVMFVGKFRIDQKHQSRSIYSITPCEPLSTILNEINRDIRHDTEIVPYATFFLNECPRCIRCDNCEKGKVDYKKQNVPYKPKEPCISNTLIFDGKSIRNRFFSHLKDIVIGGNDFEAVVAVSLRNRAIYLRDDKKVVRFSGNLERMVAFNENRNCVEEDINIGELELIPPIQKQKLIEEEEEKPTKKQKLMAEKPIEDVLCDESIEWAEKPIEDVLCDDEWAENSIRVEEKVFHLV